MVFGCKKIISGELQLLSSGNVQNLRYSVGGNPASSFPLTDGGIINAQNIRQLLLAFKCLDEFSKIHNVLFSFGKWFISVIINCCIGVPVSSWCTPCRAGPSPA